MPFVPKAANHSGGLGSIYIEVMNAFLADIANYVDASIQGGAGHAGSIPSNRVEEDWHGSDHAGQLGIDSPDSKQRAGACVRQVVTDSIGPDFPRLQRSGGVFTLLEAPSASYQPGRLKPCYKRSPARAFECKPARNSA